MRDAFIRAAYDYINFTDFGYDLHFEDEQDLVDFALSHFLYANRQ